MTRHARPILALGLKPCYVTEDLPVWTREVIFKSFSLRLFPCDIRKGGVPYSGAVFSSLPLFSNLLIRDLRIPISCAMRLLFSLRDDTIIEK